MLCLDIVKIQDIITYSDIGSDVFLYLKSVLWDSDVGIILIGNQIKEIGGIIYVYNTIYLNYRNTAY